MEQPPFRTGRSLSLPPKGWRSSYGNNVSNEFEVQYIQILSFMEEIDNHSRTSDLFFSLMKKRRLVDVHVKGESRNLETWLEGKEHDCR